MAVSWPWEIGVELIAAEDEGEFVDDSGAGMTLARFTLPISLPELRRGSYYVHIYVRDRVADIPYAGYAEGASVPGDDTICASGLVFHYDGYVAKYRSLPMSLAAC